MDKSNFSSSTTTNEAIVIDPRGDLYLRLPQNKRLRVSSKVLTIASPVFAAMLGPKFLEGQHLAASSRPVEIELKEDDGDAMMLMCQMLHHCTNISTPFDRADNGATRAILYFTILLDKYGMSQALNTHLDGLFYRQSCTMNVLEVEHMSNLVAASFILGLEGHFRRLTYQMIYEFKEPYSELLQTDSMQVLPMVALVLMEEIRSKAMLQIHRAWHTISGTRGQPLMPNAIREMIIMLSSKNSGSAESISCTIVGLCLNCVKSPNYVCDVHSL